MGNEPFCCGVGDLCVCIFVCGVKVFSFKKIKKYVTQMWPCEAESTEINYRRLIPGHAINI